MINQQQKNYLLSIVLKWGTDADDIESTAKSAILKNVVPVKEHQIRTLNIESSLLFPCFYGSMTILDTREVSDFRNMMDMPFVYGSISCYSADNVVDGSSPVVPQTDKKNRFIENFIVTSKSVTETDDQSSLLITIDFVSCDYVNFISSLADYSTFTNSSSTKPTNEIISSLFSLANIDKSRVDEKSFIVTNDIQFITTPNTSFLSAINYVYRKIFDYDKFGAVSDKDYVRVIYNNAEQKYKLWCFKNTAVASNFETEKIKTIGDMLLNELVISVDTKTTLIQPTATAIYGTSGNMSKLFNSFGDKEYFWFDYLDNKFEIAKNEKNPLNEDLFPSIKTKEEHFVNSFKNTFTKMSYNKELSFNSSSSCYRQNVSLYDMFTDVIFNSSYMTIHTNCHLGYNVGNNIRLSFNGSFGTPYEGMDGIYLITGVRHSMVKNSNGLLFYSDLSVTRTHMLENSAKAITLK